MIMLGDNDKQGEKEFYSYGKICNILKLIVHTWKALVVMSPVRPKWWKLEKKFRTAYPGRRSYTLAVK